MRIHYPESGYRENRLIFITTENQVKVGSHLYDLVSEALLASGVSNRRLLHYIHQFDRIKRRFLDQVVLSDEPFTKAKQVFEWLWQEKFTRYKRKSHYKLSDVIEMQLSEESIEIGNCLGLTVLYNCLLRRIGIYAEALYLENAFGNRPHVLTLLRIDEIEIDIENILPEGFDYRGHLNNPSRTRWTGRELIADIYHSLGNELFEKNKLKDALKNYEIAITLNPAYRNAKLNKLIVMDKLKRENK